MNEMVKKAQDNHGNPKHLHTAYIADRKGTSYEENSSFDINRKHCIPYYFLRLQFLRWI